MTTTDNIDEDRPLTRAEFCQLERMSRSTYFKIKKAGFGPAEIKFPQLTFVRITPAARRAWHQQMEEYEKSNDAKLEAARRTATATAAGKKAARSEKHVSKRAAKVGG
jgi:hypothetical protein